MKQVVAAIIVKDQKILLTRRGPNEKLSGKWEFPGGKIEPYETPEQSIQREIFEELKIKGIAKKHFANSLYEYPNGEINLQAYFFKWTEGEIILSVHDKCVWVDAHDLMKYDLAPADIPIAKKLEEEHEF